MGGYAIMTLYFYETEFGPLGLAEDDGRIVRVCLPDDAFPEGARVEESPVIREAHEQIRAYLAGERFAFTVPLDMRGSAFQLLVWRALLDIPYGATATYKDIAIAVGDSRAVRAVGMAVSLNPLPLLVPCHRVAPARGVMGGYRGGIEMKRRLLELEACHTTSSTGARRSTPSPAATSGSAT